MAVRVCATCWRLERFLAVCLRRSVFADPKFVEKIQLIRSNPTLLPSLLNTDSEVQQAYIVLSGMEQKLREDQRKAVSVMRVCVR